MSEFGKVKAVLLGRLTNVRKLNSEMAVHHRTMEAIEKSLRDVLAGYDSVAVHSLLADLLATDGAFEDCEKALASLDARIVQVLRLVS